MHVGLTCGARRGEEMLTQVEKISFNIETHENPHALFHGDNVRVLKSWAPHPQDL